jgi:hypothetical protein
MCLKYSEEATRKFKLSHSHCKRIRVNKILTLSAEGVINSFYFLEKVWIAGKNKSNRLFVKHNKSDDIIFDNSPRFISKGIHVYLTDAFKYDFSATVGETFSRKGYRHHTVINVRLNCKMEDLVGVNEEQTEAVFTKVSLPQSEIERIRNKYVKNRFGKIGNIYT